MRKFKVVVRYTESNFEELTINAISILPTKEGVVFYGQDSKIVAFTPFDKLVSVIEESESN